MVKFYLSPRPDKRGECPIRVSISIRGTRLISTAGYSIAPSKWKQPGKYSKELACVKKGHYNADGTAYNIINARLKAIDSHFSNFEIGLDHRPTIDELAEHLASLKGTTHRRQGRSKDAATALEFFDRFTTEEGSAAQWSAGTQTNWRTFRTHLQSYGEGVQLADFDENGLSRFIDQLRNTAKLSEASVQKEYKHLRWFLNWCIRKGFTKEDAVTRFKPKFKTMPKPVIYLTKEELLALYNYEIPARGTKVKLTDLEGKEYEKEVKKVDALAKSRDLFCFCCFTSLRYSDAVALKRSDISGDCIRIVTQKTSDALEIDLNDYARAILDKYKDSRTPLPYVSTHTLDDSIKALGELLGFNEPVSRTIYRAGKRTDVTQRKWECLSSHAGRRTFICYALSIGISPQVVMRWTGHSDYAAMKPYIAIADTAKQKAMQDFNKGMEE